MQQIAELAVDYKDQIAASAFLFEHGVRIAPKTLQRLRRVGGGPAFVKSRGRSLYDPDDLLTWAAQQRSPKLRSTSELSRKSTVKAAAPVTEPSAPREPLSHVSEQTKAEIRARLDAMNLSKP